MEVYLHESPQETGRQQKKRDLGTRVTAETEGG